MGATIASGIVWLPNTTRSKQMKLRTALLAATVLAAPLLASPVVAQAEEPISGMYVSLGAGVNLKMDLDVKGASTTDLGGLATGNANLHSELGPAVVGAVGYGFGNGFRAELEGNYYNNQFNSVGGGSGSFTNAGGHEQIYGAMVNGYYDFNNLIPMVTPYLGVGIGYQWANEQDLRAYGPGGNFSASGTKGSFAAQGIVGAALPLTGVPGLALTAEYRFMALIGDRTYNGTGTLAGGGSGTGSIKLGNDYNNTFLLGIRYAFGVTPPPPPPAPAPVAAPAPAPARSYLVFFDWDKATLTTRARQIIHEAAENSTHVQYTQIRVNGYTDTSGTAKYNMGLSIRRADAVAGELVRDGVPKNAIVIHGYGETHLLVPTGPNVREPQNRRVEIIIQ
jgi:OmpA-OmpF porin, OOP family